MILKCQYCYFLAHIWANLFFSFSHSLLFPWKCHCEGGGKTWQISNRGEREDTKGAGWLGTIGEKEKSPVRIKKFPFGMKKGRTRGFFSPLLF